MKIRYVTSHGRAERIDLEYVEKDSLVLSFGKDTVGAVLLGGKILPLTGGEARISLSALADGDHTPRLESEGGIYVAESFTKRGRSISVHDADESLIRRLVERCYTLEGELQEVRSRLDKLELACYGHKLLDFERKEHE